jgi:hypothetical protein
MWKAQSPLCSLSLGQFLLLLAVMPGSHFTFSTPELSDEFNPRAGELKRTEEHSALGRNLLCLPAISAIFLPLVFSIHAMELLIPSPSESPKN